MGAWVEIMNPNGPQYPVKSPPVWGRGLKYPLDLEHIVRPVSPPVWGRGLKFLKFVQQFVGLGRPRCGGVG